MLLLEEKSRTKFAILIALILVAAVIYSFTFNLFGETPSVGLADRGDSSNVSGEGSLFPGDTAILVEVTPKTVQSVVATLSRYRSYSRTIQVEYLSGGTLTGSLSVSAAVDNGWTRVDLTMPSGTEHTVIGGGACYRWYDNSSDYAVLTAGEGSDDLSQRLPTYETVLQLEPESITAAGYESRGGVTCIYVETEDAALGYHDRYWVSVESGLLVSAETLKNGEAVYRMTAYEVESPLADAGDSFVLPDGTVLHQVEG